MITKIVDGLIILDDIEGDMGQDTRLKLIQQPDGDVIVTIYRKLADGTIDSGYSIEFCTFSGGSRNPWISSKLRELIKDTMM